MAFLTIIGLFVLGCTTGFTLLTNRITPYQKVWGCLICCYICVLPAAIALVLGEYIIAAVWGYVCYLWYGSYKKDKKAYENPKE